MAFLRLLTNPRVMGADLLVPGEDISAYQNLCADDRIRFAQELNNTESLWLSLMSVAAANGSVWTDAWLAAFALSHHYKLVSFDAGMRRWPKLEAEILGS